MSSMNGGMMGMMSSSNRRSYGPPPPPPPPPTAAEIQREKEVRYGKKSRNYKILQILILKYLDEHPEETPENLFSSYENLKKIFPETDFLNNNYDSIINSSEYNKSFYIRPTYNKEYQFAIVYLNTFYEKEKRNTKMAEKFDDWFTFRRDDSYYQYTVKNMINEVNNVLDFTGFDFINYKTDVLTYKMTEPIKREKKTFFGNLKTVIDKPRIITIEESDEISNRYKEIAKKIILPFPVDEQANPIEPNKDQSELVVYDEPLINDAVESAVQTQEPEQVSLQVEEPVLDPAVQVEESVSTGGKKRRNTRRATRRKTRRAARRKTIKKRKTKRRL